ncbi:unnamed protein product, partial [Cladocopium goreaui]
VETWYLQVKGLKGAREAYLKKRRTLQKDPLSVAMVEHLEKVVMADRTPLGAGEGADWLRQLLQVSGIPSGSMGNIGTHSLKATTLSWMAKFGAPISIRQHLGYHMPSADKMALLYSRDASAGPIRKLEECLAEIRAKSFVPDATRSGYFPMQAQRPDPDVEQDLFGRGSHEHDRATDFSDSDPEDSRDDEHAFEEQRLNEEAMDHVVGPWDEHATLESLGLHEDAPLFRLAIKSHESIALDRCAIESLHVLMDRLSSGEPRTIPCCDQRRQAICPLTGVPLVDL